MLSCLRDYSDIAAELWDDKAHEFNLLEYWRDHRNDFPAMFLTVRCIMAASVTSAGCERLFSKSKLLLCDTRTCLDVDMVEKMSFLYENKHFVPPVAQLRELSSKQVAEMNAAWASHVSELGLHDVPPAELEGALQAEAIESSRDCVLLEDDNEDADCDSEGARRVNSSLPRAVVLFCILYLVFPFTAAAYQAAKFLAKGPTRHAAEWLRAKSRQRTATVKG